MEATPERIPGTLPHLLEALKDEERAVQGAAVVAIGKLLKATPSLTTAALRYAGWALKNDEVGIRRAAVKTVA